MSCSSIEYLTLKLTKVQTQIDAIEDAIDQLSGGSIKQYTLDTGQSRQTVTRSDIAELQKTLDSLYNRLVTLETRLTGCGVSIARGAF